MTAISGKNYAAQAESHEGQKRLFAEDAAKGFAFIDLCRKRFDVVLMNPPFGAASNNIKELLIKSYENSKNDIFCCFVDRGNELLLPDSLEGSITNRTCFFLDGSEKWREELFGNKVSLKIFADLGDGVLDAAMVETAAYIIKKCKHDFTCITIRVVDKNTTEKKISLSSDISKNDYNIINLSLIQNLPGKPFAYWIGNEGAKIFQKNTSILENGYTCQQGIITANDERFLRLKWETPAIMDKWSFLVKGGDYSLFYSPIYLSVLSENGFKEIDANANQKYPYLKGNASSMLHLSPELFISAGIFYTRRTSSEFSCRILRRKTVYSDKGPAIQPTFSNESKFSIIELLGIMNSSVFRSLLSFGLGATGAAARSYETGLISKIPLPKLDSEQKIKIADYVSTCLFETMALHSYDETDSFFSSPFPNNMKNSSSDISIIFHELKDESEKIKTTIKKIFEKIDKIIWDSYSIAPNRNSTFSIAIKNHNFDYLPLYNDLKEFLNKVCSYCVGVLFKRWDYDKIFNNPKKNIDIFDETPKRQPGFLCENETISVIIFSNDEIARGTKNLIHKILSDFDHKAEEDFLNNLNSKSFNEYFNFPQKFFSFHLKQYSKSRRQAPIYWPLQTPSGSYTLWVYYHRLTNQTLYTCVNDFVEPKLKIVTDDLTVLRSQTTRSSAEEKELARLSDLEGELKNFRDDLLRIAGFWKPDLNDGVQITAAPLWKLFQHRQWQNKLKDTWKKLENGEYDWAHLASSIWPERVLRKCHSDRSLAIAHDVEKDFWEEMEVPVIRRGKDTGKTKLEWQPKPLTEDGLQELIHQKMAAMRSSH
jgi:hypothetical protein